MVSELVSFIKKNNFLIFLIFYTPVLVLAETIIDDYRRYDVTKTKFNLEKSAKDLKLSMGTDHLLIKQTLSLRKKMEAFIK